MLAGAVNTAIVGSNGVLNRVSEDGVLSEWFRAPHRTYGTTSRLISLIVFLQLVAIIASRGDVYLLGEAYAFGVIWSFAFKALAVLVLRFTERSPREWKVPGNLSLAGWELPIGLGLITALLFAVAGINLLTKQIATLSGIAFTLLCFSLLLISERLTAWRRGTAHVTLDQFQLHLQEEVSYRTLGIRPGNALCLVRDFNTLAHLTRALERTDTSQQDLVVMTVRVLQGPSTGYKDLATQALFTDYEQRLFSRVVWLAETAGKHVTLLVVPSSDVAQATAHTAVQLDALEIIAGYSAVMTPAAQARYLGRPWDQLPQRPRHPVRLRIIAADGRMSLFSLGAYDPQLTTDDIELLHRLWLELTSIPGQEQIHHRDVVHVALQHLAADLSGPGRAQLLATVVAAPRAAPHAPQTATPRTRRKS